MARRQNDLQGRQDSTRTGFAKAGSNPINAGMNTHRPASNQKPPFKNWLSNFTPKIEIVKTISTQVLSANDKRNYLMLQNNSDTDVHVGYGVDATADSYTIAAGGFVEHNIIVPMNAIHLLCSVANKKLVVIEGLKI